jgi:hypothetical protein
MALVLSSLSDTCILVAAGPGSDYRAQDGVNVTVSCSNL